MHGHTNLKFKILRRWLRKFRSFWDNRTVSLRITSFCAIYFLITKFLFLHDEFCSVTTEGQNCYSRSLQYSCILQLHRCTHKRDQWITQKPGCWITHVCVIIRIPPPIVTVIHRTTAWCIVMIIPSLLNSYYKTSNKHSTKVYQLPDPIRSSKGRYAATVWELQCRFNQKRH
jgi:hypothetical protein